MGDMKWYVLRAAGGKEKKAKEYLEKEIERSGLQDTVAQVLVPVKKEIVTKNGKRKAVDKLLFPGYVLIQAELSAKLENIIRNLVPGMSGFLTEKKTTTGAQFERIPVPIREEEAQRILGARPKPSSTTRSASPCASRTVRSAVSAASSTRFWKTGARSR